MAKFTHIVIHCSDSAFGSAAEIRRWHLQNGWKDIGYHFVIPNGLIVPRTSNQTELRLFSLNGSIEVGRYLDGDKVVSGAEVGAHTLGMNDKSIGICLIGKNGFTDSQFKALANLVRELCLKFAIDRSMVYGHYDFAMKTCPNFDVQGFVRDIVKICAYDANALADHLDSISINRYRLGK